MLSSLPAIFTNRNLREKPQTAQTNTPISCSFYVVSLILSKILLRNWENSEAKNKKVELDPVAMDDVMFHVTVTGCLGSLSVNSQQKYLKRHISISADCNSALKLHHRMP